MSVGGGSVALKGFVYQFLHTLMELMDECRPARVRTTHATNSPGNGRADLLFQIEGVEDLSVQCPDSLRFYQLKDRKNFGPAELAGEVLWRFAREYAQFTGPNREFVLFTSATLEGEFYGPFCALCARARQLRQQGSNVDAADLSFTGDLNTDPLSVPKAAVWASNCGEGEEPVPRDLTSTDSVKDFLSWLLECLFVQDAGITNPAVLLDFLSRIEIDDGHNWESLRTEVLARIQDRLPANTARRRLDEALGVLVSWAADHGGEWVEAHTLLKMLRLPPPISWGGVQRGCAETAQEPVGHAWLQDESHQAHDEAIAFFRLWLEANESPLFLLGTVGQPDNGWLVGKFSEVASGVAPVVAVDCSYDDQDIVRSLLKMGGGESVNVGEWSLSVLIEHLRDSADRPDELPSVVLLIEGFAGTQIHSDRVSRWLRLIIECAGFVLLVAEEAALRMLDEHVIRQWAGLTWRPGRGRPGAGDRGHLQVSCWLSPPAADLQSMQSVSLGFSLEETTQRIARPCNRTYAGIANVLDSIVRTAIAEAPGSGAIPSDALEQLPLWDWSSTAPDALPQAAINEGLFKRNGEILLLMPTSATVMLVKRCIGSMDLPQVAEFSDRLARTPLTSDVVLNGFVLWLADFASSGPEEGQLLDVLRPWAEDSHWQWTPYVFEQAGRAAFGPLRVLAEELAGQVLEGDAESHRAEARLRRLLEFARATGAPELADWALGWARGTGSVWLRQQIMSFFALETGEPGLEDLLDELRETSEGIVQG